MFKIKSTLNSLNNKYHVLKSNILKYNSNSQENQVNIKLQSHLIKTHSGNVIENQQKVDNIKIKSEYYPGIFWVKCSGSLIKDVYLKHVDEVKVFKIFEDEEFKELKNILDSYIKLMQHPTLCKNKEELNVNLLTKTSIYKSYNHYNSENGILEKTTPHKLKEFKVLEKKIQFYSSSKIYEMPLKSEVNGDVLINVENYKYAVEKYNLSKDWIEAEWVEYFKTLQLKQNKIIKIDEFVKNDYTLKNVMLNKASIKYEKKQIDNIQLVDLQEKLYSLEVVKIDKEEMVKYLKLNE